MLFCHDCVQGERQEEMQKRRQYSFRVLMRARVHKITSDCLRYRFAIWRVCPRGWEAVCVCVYSLGSFTHPQPPFSIGMSVYTLCGILRMQGAMREIQNVQQREWVQEAAGDRCVVLKSNTNQTLRLSCCTPVSYIHMYIYIYPSRGIYMCTRSLWGVLVWIHRKNLSRGWSKWRRALHRATNQVCSHYHQ